MESSNVMNEGVDIELPISSVMEACDRYSNTLYGYFIGKRVVYPVVKNYVMNTWAKYGIEKTMMNSKGFYFFKFVTSKGMLDVLENGPWMIRTVPIMLNKWAANVWLTKEDLSKVPGWVKLFDVPFTGYTEDGLSMIASKVGKPIMLDSYTSTMCVEAWGRPNYARAMIEISAESELRTNLKVGTPGINGASSLVDTVTIEYEWKPPRCSGCKVFGHRDAQCRKNIPVQPATKVIDSDGFQSVKPSKVVTLNKK
ncbi:uncharacterized protein [Rutidosis leptorrhynchoides]|uniref:uncharacterized protein n=1 Tax=Rutidosis leptorrhynchoides TaxID=125765 RepID=UPI003A99364F